MATMQELRGLVYPRTYMPAVAGPAGDRAVLLVETESGPEGVALRPILLCQDWDGRVVIHWEDDRGSCTYTVLDVTEDSAARFAFERADEPAGAVWLTPLSYERFEREWRSRDPEAGNVPRFESEEQFRRWFLPG
ncbi:MAG TPA: hypothetical protein VH916_01235 [Dehalococcoidia bacterium]|jgi:hypothetical protein